MTNARSNQRLPVRPDRVRRIEGGFAFIPIRFLHDGFFAALSGAELELYFFLVVAGDRQGVSFYHYDRILSLLKMDLDTYVEARNGLVQKDLVAFDGSRFQVLSLPSAPCVEVAEALTSAEALDEGDRAAARQDLLRSLRRPGGNDTP